MQEKEAPKKKKKSAQTWVIKAAFAHTELFWNNCSLKKKKHLFCCACRRAPDFLQEGKQMMGGAVLLRKMPLAQTAGTWWHVIYMCSSSCFLTDKKALSHLQFRWGTQAALQCHWPLGHVSYRIRNICHFANEFSIKSHPKCSFRMRQHSARKPEKQPPPASAGMVCPIFTSWDESKDWEGEAGEKERPWKCHNYKLSLL